MAEFQHVNCMIERIKEKSRDLHAMLKLLLSQLPQWPCRAYISMHVPLQGINFHARARALARHQFP